MRGIIMIREKRAVLRIIEAVFAILLVAGAAVYLYTQQTREADIQQQVYEIEDGLLREISANAEFRGYILANDSAGINEINDFISSRLPRSLNFTTRICAPDDVCGMPTYISRDVYAKEVFISSTITTYHPKKFKIFVWMK